MSEKRYPFASNEVHAEAVVKAIEIGHKLAQPQADPLEYADAVGRFANRLLRRAYGKQDKNDDD